MLGLPLNATEDAVTSIDGPAASIERCEGGKITALGPTDNPLFGPPDSISDQHEHVARVQLLRPPKSISVPHERLVASMLKHWRAGLLGFLWAQAVRADCPETTLDEFHDAAGEARPLLAGTP